MKKLLGITIFLLVVYAALLASHKNAMSFDTHFKLGERIGLYGILSLAAGLLIVTGGIDLSMGSLICLCSTVFGILVVDKGVSIGAAFLVILILGAGVGLANGLLVTKIGLQPFMVTLCGLFIFRSLARWLTDDTKIEELDSKVQEIAVFFNSGFLEIPTYLYILAGLVALAGVFLHLSVYGRYFYALGSNEKAAQFSGIPVDNYKIFAYVLCSFFAALYSFLAVMKYPSVSPSNTGQNDELMAIAGAVLGGCTLRGGEGTVYGMVVGTMIIQILLMMNTFYRIPSAAEGMVVGFILLLGIILDELLRRRERAKG
jgi:ribose transport system permease protein